MDSLNAQVLGISVEPPFAHKAWADANNLNFPVLSDFDRELVYPYDVALANRRGLQVCVTANRAMFIVDRGGWCVTDGLSPLRPTDPILQRFGGPWHSCPLNSGCRSTVGAGSADARPVTWTRVRGGGRRNSTRIGASLVGVGCLPGHHRLR